MRRLLLPLVILLALCPPASAITKTYSGPNNGFWTDNANWLPANAPMPGDTVRLINSGGAGVTVNFNDSSSYSPNGAWLESLTIDGNSLVHPDSGIPDSPFVMAALTQYVGLNGSAGYTQRGGVNNADSLFVAYNPGSAGAYYLNAGQINANLIVIADDAGAQGLFTQFGGVNKINGNLVLGGFSSTSNGTYLLYGTTLTSTNASIGDKGIGYFSHNGGSNSIANTLRVGAAAGSNGKYEMYFDSTLSAATEIIGDSGTGNFSSTAGSNTTATLILGNSPSGNGTYGLGYTGNLNTTGNEIIGASGTAFFGQNGGVHTANNIIISQNPGSLATYYFLGGSIAANSIVINPGGLFQQFGGTLNASTINENGGSIGGTLQNQHTFNYNSGLFNARLWNQGTINLNADFTAEIGLQNDTTFDVPLGRSVTLKGSDGLSNNGVVTLEGNLTVDGNDTIGYHAPASFEHNSGTHTSTGYLLIGSNAEATYHLHDGNLTTNTAWIGDTYAGIGHFIHDAGTHSSAFLSVGHYGQGSYDMTSGSLTVSDTFIVAESNDGNFTQHGGDVSAAIDLTVGRAGNYQGAYTQNAGTLTVAGDELIGPRGAGIFTQNGGIHTIAGKLMIGATEEGRGGHGNFNFSAGILNLNIVCNNDTFSAAGTLNISNTFYNNGTANIGGIQNWAIGSSLIAQSGIVTLQTNTAGPAASPNLTITIPDAPAGVILNADQDVKNVSINFAAAGAQSLDLNSPTLAGAFRSLRAYPADLAAAKQNLWAAIVNANRPDAPDPHDGIYDSGLPAHPNSAIGIARLIDSSGNPYLLIRPTRIGDLNLDGTVSIADFIDLASHFNQSGTWQEGDVNYDGNITIADFIDLASQFNTSYSAADTQLVASFAQSLGIDPSIIGSAVPEPAALSLLALPAVARRRRK
jgi:hypothetical protein